MTERQPRSLAQIMSGSEQLKALDQARRARANWTRMAQGWLPREVAPHLVAAAVDGLGNLVLSFDSAAWAARSRYLERQIIAAAADPAIKTVKVRVHPRGGRPSSGGGGDK